MATDRQRLLYVMKAAGVDGFCHVEQDRYEYALQAAQKAGRDEPNDDDEFNGFRRLIDAAIAAETKPSRGGDYDR